MIELLSTLLDGVWSLWKAVADSGLMGDVLVSIQNQLDAALTGLDLRMRDARLQARGEASRHQSIKRL